MKRSRTYTVDGVRQRKCIDCEQSFPLESGEFAKSKKDPYGYNIRCRVCIRKAADAYKARKENTMADGKVMVLNQCGHEFPYRIKQTSAIKWLEKQPCPPCRAKGISAGSPPPASEPEVELPEPEPQPQPEPDSEWVASIVATLPKAALFHSVLPKVMLLTRANVPVWLQGPPGTSKSTLAQQVADGLDTGFYPISCHELMTRSDLFGFADANGNQHRTPLWDAYENGGVCLLDEVDNGNPNLLAALNSALSNGHCVFGSGIVVQRHSDFRVIATANTAGLGPESGYVGRNGVDLATRDRFVTVEVPIDSILEDALCEVTLGTGSIDELAGICLDGARELLEKMSIDQTDVTARKIVDSVKSLRGMVESRYKGTVVSPRTTIHAAAMIRAGFTLTEALSSKLPGLKATEISDLIAAIR